MNEKGQYHIKIENSTGGLVGEYFSSGVEQGDIQRTFEVYEAATYTVIVKKKIEGEFIDLSASPMIVEIMWPEGPPLVYVFLDGEDIM